MAEEVGGPDDQAAGALDGAERQAGDGVMPFRGSAGRELDRGGGPNGTAERQMRSFQSWYG